MFTFINVFLDSMFNYNRYRNYKSAVVLHTGPLNSNRLQVFTFCSMEGALLAFVMTLEFLPSRPRPSARRRQRREHGPRPAPAAPTVTAWITFVFTHANLCL